MRDREHFRGVPVSKRIVGAGQAANLPVSPESHGLLAAWFFSGGAFGFRLEWPQQSGEHRRAGPGEGRSN